VKTPKTAKQPKQAPAAFGAQPAVGNAALLEAEVERRKKLRGEPREQRAAKEPQPIQEALGQVLARHGLTWADVQAADAKIERESALRAAEVERCRLKRAWRYKCPLRFQEKFLHDLAPADVPRSSIDAVLNYQLGDRGIYLIGETRRCKTRAMFALLRRLFFEGRSVEWFDGIGFAVECSRVFAESALAETWLWRLTKPDVLFIDDLAKRFTPATQQGFFAVLDRRTAAKKPVLLTTNCTGETLAEMTREEQLTEPMLGRLQEFCDVVVF
jgi:DNA replication protein DnaC